MPSSTSPSTQGRGSRRRKQNSATSRPCPTSPPRTSKRRSRWSRGTRGLLCTFILTAQTPSSARSRMLSWRKAYTRANSRRGYRAAASRRSVAAQETSGRRSFSAGRTNSKARPMPSVRSMAPWISCATPTDPRRASARATSSFGRRSQSGRPSRTSIHTTIRNLNHYIEAQVHGDVRLREDVEILVADPSFKGTLIGRTLETICERYAIRCYWHCGFVLSVADVPTDFRGPSMPSLAQRVATHDLVDAAAIGRAAMDLKRDPSLWADRGSYAAVLQELKLMWHVLVRFGTAWSASGTCQRG